MSSSWLPSPLLSPSSFSSLSSVSFTPALPGLVYQSPPLPVLFGCPLSILSTFCLSFFTLFSTWFVVWFFSGCPVCFLIGLFPFPIFFLLISLRALKPPCPPPRPPPKVLNSTCHTPLCSCSDPGPPEGPHCQSMPAPPGCALVGVCVCVCILDGGIARDWVCTVYLPFELKKKKFLEVNHFQWAGGLTYIPWVPRPHLALSLT